MGGVMVDWSGHYDPIYDALGVAAVLNIAESGAAYSLTVIDKTGGIALQDGGVEISTVRSACAARAHELVDKGIDVSSLDGSQITFNAKTWRIEQRITRPSPSGEAIGEIYLTLTEVG